MPLPSFFQRLRAASADTRSRNSDPAALAQARARARRRLIGAVILVIAAVAGFPLLFDSQPRPLPSDLSVQLVKSNGEVQTAQVEPKPVGTPAAERPAKRADDTPAADEEKPPRAEKAEKLDKPAKAEPAAEKPVHATTKPEPEKKPVAQTADAGKDKPAKGEKAPAKPELKPIEIKTAEADRARALLEDREPAAGTPPAKPASKPAAASKPTAADAEGTRFVVQVGAYADADAAREARSKVERLGLKTYTQVIEGPSGKRIRVRIGPFNQRSGADQAAAKIKQAGLTAAVLTL